MIDKSRLRGIARLRAGGHGDEIIVIDVNTARQPVLVPLLFGPRTASAGRSAQRSHRPRASGVHEACLTQLLRIVRRDLVAQNAAHSAPLARTLAAALALNPN